MAKWWVNRQGTQRTLFYVILGIAPKADKRFIEMSLIWHCIRLISNDSVQLQPCGLPGWLTERGRA